MTASFLPPLDPRSRFSAAQSAPSKHQRQKSTAKHALSNASASASASNSLAPTSASASANVDSSTPTPNNHSAAPFPPVTPNPFPSMRGSEDHYAQVEGQVVWEAEVLDEWKVIRTKGSDGSDGGWTVVWKGEVPVGELGSPCDCFRWHWYLGMPWRASGANVRRRGRRRKCS
jgi:hypothetical protein